MLLLLSRSLPWLYFLCLKYSSPPPHLPTPTPLMGTPFWALSSALQYQKLQSIGGKRQKPTARLPSKGTLERSLTFLCLVVLNSILTVAIIPSSRDTAKTKSVHICKIFIRIAALSYLLEDLLFSQSFHNYWLGQACPAQSWHTEHTVNCQ